MSKGRDYEQMEERRLQGARLLAEGMGQAEVARRLDVKRQSVHEWVKVIEAQGEKGLARVPAGRKPRLNAVQLEHLGGLLKAGPQAHGYATALWTTERIARLIKRQFGVRYHRDHSGRLLGQMGWSCQRPTGRARERKEEEIARWKRVEWPRIQKNQSRRAHTPLHRREWPESEAAPGAHMESQRPNADLGVQLQLEKTVGHRRSVLVELLLSSLPRRDQDRAGDRLLEASATSREGQAAYRLGRRGHPPQPTRA